MADEFQEMKVIEQAVFETLLSDKDRAEVNRLLDRIAELTRERDEARAEVERLQTASVASVDRWMEFVSHFQRLVRSNMGTEAGKLAIGYFKRAAEAGNLDEAGPPTVTPRDAAASERAAIVAWLEKRADALGLKTSQQFRDQSDECEYLATCITRLDHHRDGDTP